MGLILILFVIMIAVFCYVVQSEKFDSPFWKKVGMAIALNNQFNEDQYILEELPLGNNKFLYKATYTYGTVPPVWYLKGDSRAEDGEIRRGYIPGLKGLLPKGIMLQKLPDFRLKLEERSERSELSERSIKQSEWIRVGYAAPDYNHFTKNLYILWEKYYGRDYYKYKVSEIYSEMPTTWILRGTEKVQDGEIRLAQHRSRSNNFLKFRLNVVKENFYPGAGVNPWTGLYSSGYKAISHIPPSKPITDWETIGRAGMHLSSGRPPYFNYILQEQRLQNGMYQYRVFNPETENYVYIWLKGNEKARNLQIREALPSVLSFELPGFYVLSV